MDANKSSSYETANGYVLCKNNLNNQLKYWKNLSNQIVLEILCYLKTSFTSFQNILLEYFYLL